jgi:glycosyltransferase involved in cell wall biosynthesis
MINNIKVLHTEWSDGWGGQEIRIINEMIAVREQGVKVCLACRDNSIIKQKAIENNIQVFVLPFRGNVDLKTLFSLVKIIKDNKIDIVNTHSGKDTWVGGIAAKLSGAKFIRTRHLSNRIRSSRFNFINEIADYVFTTGESVKADMIKYNRVNPNKIISIPTGIDDELFDPNKYNRAEERKKLNINDNEIAIGIVAVIRSFKRHDLFVLAAEKLLQKHTNLKFFIAGDGPLKDNIKKDIETKNLTNNIILLGHINEPERILSALNIFVLSSDSKEGVPQSVMQALLMNKKVIATDVGSTSDLYENDSFKLINPNSLDEIVNSVEEYLIDTREINTRNFIVDNFSKKVMCKKIINIYKKLKGFS